MNTIDPVRLDALLEALESRARQLHYEFATVSNPKTEQLVRELRQLIGELRFLAFD